MARSHSTRTILAALAAAALTITPDAHGQAAPAVPQSVAQIFGAENSQALLMQMEAALARVQARRGIIPEAAAQEIARTASPAFVPVAAVEAERAKVGNPMVALVNVWAKVTRGDAGEYIHYGPTTQDIYDTTQLMQMRQAAGLFITQMRDIEASMLRLAREHRQAQAVVSAHLKEIEDAWHRHFGS